MSILLLDGIVARFVCHVNIVKVVILALWVEWLGIVCNASTMIKCYFIYALSNQISVNLSRDFFFKLKKWFVENKNKHGYLIFNVFIKIACGLFKTINANLCIKIHSNVRKLRSNLIISNIIDASTNSLILFQWTILMYFLRNKFTFPMLLSF